MEAGIPPSLKITRIAWQVIDFVMPPVCGGCGKPGLRWCDECNSTIERLPRTICPICGQPRSAFGLCADCRASVPPIKELRSFAYFKGAFRSGLHRIKYSQDFGLAERFSSFLINMLQEELKWSFDLVTVVPLSAERHFERGYNQTALLGRIVALGIRKPFRPDLLVRQRNTPSQVGMSKVERRANIHDAFRTNEKLAKDRSVLIIDDVTTTGSTLIECARSLKAGNSADVYGLTLARTPYKPDSPLKINENLI